MARCDLTLVLEDADRTYRPGDTVSGRVDVQADRPVSLDDLTVELAWRTHGRGNTDRGVGPSLQLFEGDLGSSGLRSFPFRLTCPPGPFTYHGETLHVDWWVEARADLPWAVDPTAREQIALVPPEPGVWNPSTTPLAREVVAGLGGGMAELVADEPESSGGDGTPGTEAAPRTVVLTESVRRRLGRDRKRGERTGWAFVGCFFLPFVIGGLSLLGIGTARLVEYLQAGRSLRFLPEDIWGPLAGGAMFTFLCLFFLAGVIRQALARTRLGKVTLELDDPVLVRGDTVSWRFAFQPRRAVDLDAVTARVVCRERVTAGSGSNRRTHVHVVSSHELDLSPARRLGRNEPFEASGRFRLPDGAPVSFHASDNSLEWVVQCQVELARWSDWESEEPFVVVG